MILPAEFWALVSFASIFSVFLMNHTRMNRIQEQIKDIQDILDRHLGLLRNHQQIILNLEQKLKELDK